MADPKSLKRQISPPPTRKLSEVDGDSEPRQRKRSRITPTSNATPSLAAVEAGQAEIQDHLEYFATRLEPLARPVKAGQPRLSFKAYRDLYLRNQNDTGRHFVVHQHDHPVAGVHYDLRLQFSATSSVSWSIPYGLPGNPRSIRPNRMAVETRVHNFWNNLIESASHATGSLLIWDTGEYEVLPYRETRRDAADTDEDGNLQDVHVKKPQKTPSLLECFQDHHIRLRLHGTRLPKNYTIALRLPSANDKSVQPSRPLRRRRREYPSKALKAINGGGYDSSASESDTPTRMVQGDPPDDSPLTPVTGMESDDEAHEDEAIRLNNAYPGATNTVGSIHQRQWFLTLDKRSSGFVKARSGPERGRWVRRLEDSANGEVEPGGFETFIVRGREEERSVLTGRLARDVMEDEGITGYRGRANWRAITE